MRKKIIAANWKMNITISEAESFIEDFQRDVADVTGVEIVIAPAFTSLPKVSQLLANSRNIRLGAQNFHPQSSGAFTGEISASMLRELFVRYVIIGHSERRQLFGETDAFINQKVLAAKANELKPILCIGETLAEREAGREKEILASQLRGALVNVPAKEFADLVIAYEPVWAIGTGKTASAAQAQDAHAHAREVLAELSDAETAKKIRIQYGGSVKPDNAAELLHQPDIDGALVGGASLESRNFTRIVTAAVEASGS